jgi:hypothetical protein
MTVGSGFDKSPEDVVAVVSGLGVTVANLVGVSALLPMVGGLLLTALYAQVPGLCGAQPANRHR